MNLLALYGINLISESPNKELNVMKKVLTLFILAALAAAAGCTPTPEAVSDITGLIYQIEGDTILVVEGIDDTDIPYEEWFENGHNAIAFTVTSDTILQMGSEKISFDQLQAGQKAEVWSTRVLLESYPQQGTAKKVVVVKKD